MKKQKTEPTGSVRQQREAADELLEMPTLGLVAEEERFAVLRELIQPIAATPVNELGKELRNLLQEEAGDKLPVVLAFFAACSVRAKEVERKRAHLVDAAPALRPLDHRLLVSPLDVMPFDIPKEEPAFCAEDGWLDSCFAGMMKWLDAAEEQPDRVCPTAYIRCSRGGKTRALFELNRLCKERLPQVSTIYITFNDFSSLDPWEMCDPVGAFCRRVAFSALRERDATRFGFDSFRHTDVSENDIISWLAGTPCLLLIDELNVLELDAVGARHVAHFLKKHFLFQRGRYFAFSSHVVPSGRGLTDFMDAVSERGVIVHQLPLIPSMEDARTKFHLPDLTVRQALFRARIPALIWVTRGPAFHFVKREAAIAEVAHDWNDNKVKELLSSFLSGEAFRVPQPLLQLMSVAPIEGQKKLVWIPYHMVHVLESIAGSASLTHCLRRVVTTISEMFRGFETGKTSGGDSWEALFAIAVMIRLATGSFHQLLSLSYALPKEYGISYNRFWEQRGDLSFRDLTTLDQLIAGLVDPFAYPHVAVYYPPHTHFEVYDLIVVFHQAQDRRIVYGYQLKEGREIPKSMSSDACQRSYVIRSYAAQQETLLRGWHVASDDEIESFLGVTGSCLAPKQWRVLAQ